MPAIEKPPVLHKRNKIEIRFGYFFFKSLDLREIYHNGSLDVEAEYNYLLTSQYSIWTNLNCIWKSGKSVTLRTPTDVMITTVSFGVKEFFPIWKETVKLYLGLGATGAYVQIQDETDSLPKKTYRWSPGMVGKFGFFFQGISHVYSNVFFDYYYQPTPARKSSSLSDAFIDMGGFRTGVGIGWHF